MEKQIAANNFKTGLLFALVTLFFLITGGIIGLITEDYVWAAVILAGGLIYTIATYNSASKQVINLNKAQQATRKSHRDLYLIVENLSITLGIKTPRIYVIDDPALNAFAAGHTVNKSVIGVTTGLLAALERRELEGVMAHEMSHIVNRDVRVATIVFALVAGISIMSYFNIRSGGGRSNRSGGGGAAILIIIAISILMIILAFFARMAVSRRREYLADVTGAQITKYPDGLADALEKIRLHGSKLRTASTSTAHFFLDNPLKRSFMARFFSTHPPLEDRIARLRRLNELGY